MCQTERNAKTDTPTGTQKELKQNKENNEKIELTKREKKARNKQPTT